MKYIAPFALSLQAVARDARAAVELALEMAGWSWSPRLSLWIDALLILEETGA